MYEKLLKIWKILRIKQRYNHKANNGSLKESNFVVIQYVVPRFMQFKQPNSHLLGKTSIFKFLINFSDSSISLVLLFLENFSLYH